MASSSQASASSSSPRLEPVDTSVPANSGTSFTFVLNDLSQANQKAPEKSQTYDRFAHTRTKRKRTSPADFAILEREYECESRPNKERRIDIASRVSLNEKEVQIWFQNRRQMTRRKARTWQPNEISEIIRSSQQSVESTSPPSSQEGDCSSQYTAAAETEEKTDCSTNQKPAAGLFQITSPSSFHQEQDPKVYLEKATVEESRDKDEPQYQSNAAQITNLGKEASTHYLESSQTSQEGAQGCDGPSQGSKKALKRTSSNIRLRMSLEGRAELVQDTNSPSPPAKTNRRESWTARGGLKRSQSALNPPTSSLEQTSLDAPPSSQPKEVHRPVGRSRDARTWEFFCDSDARDALSVAAEHDRKGSAQAALNLVRSNSGYAGKKPLGSPLMPSLRKQNPSVAAKAPEKRKGRDNLTGARAKLARTSSSVARLQTVDLLKAGDSDSDKENWQPGTRISAPTHPRPGSSRPTLGLNTNGLSNAEVEDLNAVHSLLSLGGTW